MRRQWWALLVVTCVAAYAACYFSCGRSHVTGTGTIFHVYDSERLARIFFPAAWLEAQARMESVVVRWNEGEGRYNPNVCYLATPRVRRSPRH